MEKEQPWKKLKHIWEKKESYLSAQNSIEVLNLLFINEKKKKNSPILFHYYWTQEEQK